MKEVDGGGSGTHQQEVPLCDICEDEHADIRTIRALDTRSTDPAASTAAGEGLTVAKVGEAAEFVVTAMEVGSGKQQRDGGDEVVASLVQQHTADKGDGGGGGAATTNPKRGKRKRGGCSGTGNSRSRTAKKNKTGSATSRLVPANPYTTVGDNGDGTYNCSYTLPEGADEVGGGKWQLGVLLNGRHIGGSPFAIEVRPSATITNWVFGSVVAAECHLSEGGAVATKLEDESEAGTIADGGGCTPMIHGLHFWELEVVKNEADLDFAPGGWFFGVCRPGIDVDDGEAFHTRDDTWMMYQSNNPSWHHALHR